MTEHWLPAGPAPLCRQRPLNYRLMSELTKITDAPVDDFAYLQASAHIRTRLIDESPLVHQINRSHRMKYAFNPCAESPFITMVQSENPTFWIWMDAISPRFAPPWMAATERVKLDRFLAKRAAQGHGRDVSVRDLVLQLANIEGGIHAGTPSTELQHRLSAMSETFRVGGAPSGWRGTIGLAGHHRVGER
jgi:hypothetical protein